MLKIKGFALFLTLLVAAAGMLAGCTSEAPPQDASPVPGKGPPQEMHRQAEEVERRASDQRRQMENGRMELDRMRNEMRGQVEREREQADRARRTLEERRQELKARESIQATKEADLRASNIAELEAKIADLEVHRRCEGIHSSAMPTCILSLMTIQTCTGLEAAFWNT